MAEYLLGDGEACYLVSFYAMFSMIFNFVEVTDEDDDDAVTGVYCFFLERFGLEVGYSLFPVAYYCENGDWLSNTIMQRE